MTQRRFAWLNRVVVIGTLAAIGCSSADDAGGSESDTRPLEPGAAIGILLRRLAVGR